MILICSNYCRDCSPVPLLPYDGLINSDLNQTLLHNTIFKKIYTSWGCGRAVVTKNGDLMLLKGLKLNF